MLDILKDGLKTAFGKKLTWAAIVLIPVIVALFGLLYVNTFMDPIGNMAHMPVAVVNLDEGTTVNDEQENYGDELLESILENDAVDWRAEEPSLLDAGLENSDYYIAVVIPADFSQRVAAGETAEPEQASIVYFRNVRKSYMLSTFASRIESSLSSVVNEKVGEQYSKALAQGLVDAGDGFDEAADGAGELADGAWQVADAVGTATDGAGELADGADELADGADKAADGAGELATGAQAASTGLATLSAKGDDLEGGWSSLYAGITKATDAASTIAGGLSEGAESIQTALDQAQEGAGQLDAAKAAYQQALAEYTAAVADAAAAGTPESAEVQAAGTRLTAAVEALGEASAASGASEALAQAQAAVDAASGGAQRLHDASATLQEGADSFDSGLAAYLEGVDSAAAGMEELAEGASSLDTGVTAVAEGAQTLNAGARTLATGMGELDDDATQVAEGSATLADSLEEGAGTIGDSLTATPEEYAQYISEPVEIEDDAYGDLGEFGYGFAPFFMTLCFWLGTLLIFFIFDPYPSQAHLGASRFKVVFGRWPLYLMLLALEIAAVCGGSLAIGVPHTSLGWYILVFIVTGFSFMCLMQFFNLFDIAGKALAILVLIFQICCGSGTFPAFLGADYAQVIGPFLPFTYAIDAFREVLSGGNFATAGADLLTLLLFAAAGVTATLLAYPLGLKMKKKRDAQTLAALSRPAHARHAA